MGGAIKKANCKNSCVDSFSKRYNNTCMYMCSVKIITSWAQAKFSLPPHTIPTHTHTHTHTHTLHHSHTRTQIEGLLEDVDFKAQVTRGDLEELSADLFERVGGPIQQALDAADMTMDEIDSVILVGGGTRVPKVQETLLQVVNK